MAGEQAIHRQHRQTVQDRADALVQAQTAFLIDLLALAVPADGLRHLTLSDLHAAGLPMEGPDEIDFL